MIPRIYDDMMIQYVKPQFLVNTIDGLKLYHLCATYLNGLNVCSKENKQGVGLLLNKSSTNKKQAIISRLNKYWCGK